MHFTVPVRRAPYIISGGIVLAAAAVYAVLPQLDGFQGAWKTLQHAAGGTVVATIVMSLLASVCSVGIYKILSFKPLTFMGTLLVQLSGLCINRILPAGIGGLGLNFLYLRARRHSIAQATTVVALNNLIGFLGHMLLTVIVLVVYGNRVRVDLSSWSHAGYYLAVALALVGVAAVLLRRLSPLWARMVQKQFGLLAAYYVKRPRRLTLALLISCALTLCNVVSFWLCCRAVGVSINFGIAFLIFTFGVAATTATPTPGGLGGVEAALATGLATQHIAWSQALAATLLYRLISFWLGLPLGAAAFGVVQSRRLLRATHPIR